MKLTNLKIPPSLKSQQGPSSTYFPYCCPQSSLMTLPDADSKKRYRGFIKLTLLKDMTPIKIQKIEKHSNQHIISINSVPSVQVFQTDKFHFLQQIRKFNPNPQKELEETLEKHGKTMESSKEMQNSMRSNENNLSNILENISSDMFSEMFVSSGIKAKIMLSGSLGSISEVKSDLEISNPTESLVNNLHFTDEH